MATRLGWVTHRVLIACAVIASVMMVCPAHSQENTAPDNTLLQLEHPMVPRVRNTAPVDTLGKTALQFVCYPDTAWVYRHIGGDPAGIPLREQVQHMIVPDAVRAAWLASIDSGARPDTIWLVSTKEKPLTCYSLGFGGRWNHVFKIRPRAMCAWVDSAGARIDSTQAFAYAPVDFGDVRYTLVQIKKCTNGAFLRGPAPLVAAEPKEEPPPQPEQPPLPTVTRVVPTAFPYQPGKAANIVVNGTVWLTGEYVDRQDGGNHANGFAGTELIVRKSYGNHNLGYVFRVGGGAIGAPNAEGQFQTGGAQLRAGIRRPMFTPTAWDVSLELGGYADGQQLVWRDEEQVSPTRIHWEDRRSTVYDGGGYVRTVGYGPQRFGWDARASTGGKLRSEYEAETGCEPGPLVFRAAYHETRYRDRDVHNDGKDAVVGANSFRTREAFVGFRPKLNHRLTVGWKQWTYHAPTWAFEWRGPAIAYDWKINNPWRVRVDVTRFNDTKEIDPHTGTSVSNDHTRGYLGVNYDF